MGQPDVAALLASITLAQFLAWTAYYAVEPWDLPNVALAGLGRKAPTPEQIESRLERAALRQRGGS